MIGGVVPTIETFIEDINKWLAAKTTQHNYDL